MEHEKLKQKKREILHKTAESCAFFSVIAFLKLLIMPFMSTKRKRTNSDSTAGINQKIRERS